MSDATAPRLGIVTQVSPLLVRLNGDTVAITAFSLDDFTGATVGVTECIVVTVERRQFASRVR